VRDDVIVMQTMLWPDEIRSADFASLGEDTDAKPAELAMANMLVESLAGDYRAEDYEDDYQQAVEALVTAKLEGGEVQEQPAARETGGEVVDLLAALQRSVERAKAARGEAS
jgi:DNA end-binding protein Ku